eukprot:CAMPEP_0174331990 /NCGR_PEP_ID=MMETSP0810-20121108/17932_1 /TAXON_ID=73025 ORGANISM="Eutreptiella gymnastica-like, Strain CCMP1594" /NCGR_SAMPLE_ID=MMETSP0810 /ASSEMBLY_ACC=CAM_ASM_000659 /LENGTH=210 /DNA_ID=CAMNT_0015448115 /DNA_START=32 /DNA_END=660 /DNA_ORIENTATION=+
MPKNYRQRGYKAGSDDEEDDPLVPSGTVKRWWEEGQEAILERDTIWDGNRSLHPTQERVPHDVVSERRDGESDLLKDGLMVDDKFAMEPRLFVGNLSWNTTDESLCRHFEEIAPVRKAWVVMDTETGSKSRGFGFVECTSQDGAVRAVQELDGSHLDGRDIRVKIAERNPSRARHKDGGPGRQRGRTDDLNEETDRPFMTNANNGSRGPP